MVDKEQVDCTTNETEVKWTCPPVRNVTHPLRYYEFTQEEIKALEECDKESFYQRCLPFSTLFASLTYAGIRFDYSFIYYIFNKRIKNRMAQYKHSGPPTQRFVERKRDLLE